MSQQGEKRLTLQTLKEKDLEEIDFELVEQFKQMYLNRFNQEISSKEAVKHLRLIALIFEATILDCKGLKYGK